MNLTILVILFFRLPSSNDKSSSPSNRSRSKSRHRTHSAIIRSSTLSPTSSPGHRVKTVGLSSISGTSRTDLDRKNPQQSADDRLSERPPHDVEILWQVLSHRYWGHGSPIRTKTVTVKCQNRLLFVCLRRIIIVGLEITIPMTTMGTFMRQHSTKFYRSKRCHRWQASIRSGEHDGQKIQ